MGTTTTTFGSATYNTDIYGGEPSLDLAPFVTAVEILAADLLSVTFSEPMKVNAAFVAAASYTVVPVSTGVSVTVKDAQAGAEASVTEVTLCITIPTLGVFYDVAVVGAGIRSASNQTMSSVNSKTIKTRRTKVDSLLSKGTSNYSLKPTAVYRNILNAIGIEDDRIGGSQKEGEDIVR